MVGERGGCLGVILSRVFLGAEEGEGGGEARAPEQWGRRGRMARVRLLIDEFRLEFLPRHTRLTEEEADSLSASGFVIVGRSAETTTIQSAKRPFTDRNSRYRVKIAMLYLSLSTNENLYNETTFGSVHCHRKPALTLSLSLYNTTY